MDLNSLVPAIVQSGALGAIAWALIHALGRRMEEIADRVGKLIGRVEVLIEQRRSTDNIQKPHV